MQYYQNILANNQIINIIVTTNDINRDEAIDGPIFAILKGEMSRKYHNIYRMCHKFHCPAYYYTITKKS